MLGSAWGEPRMRRVCRPTGMAFLSVGHLGAVDLHNHEESRGETRPDGLSETASP